MNGDKKTFLSRIFTDRYNIFVAVLFVITFGFWVIVRFTHTQDATINYLWSLFLGVVPAFASLKGIVASKRWGGRKSVLGRAVGALAFGLLLWSIGELIWSYYNLVEHVSAPYPSLADIGYGLGVTGWIFSAYLLSKTVGIRLWLKKRPVLWVLVVGVVLLSVAVTYYFSIEVARDGIVFSDRTNIIKAFLDLYYPLADFISLTIAAIAAIVCGKYLGGTLRTPLVFAFLGFLGMYIGDNIFSYTTTKDTFYNGDWGDLALFIGSNLISMSLLAYAAAVPSIASAKVVKTEGNAGE